jgi:DNA-binding NtrC family response regulator
MQLQNKVHHVVVLDLDTKSCPTGHCRKLEERLKRAAVPNRLTVWVIEAIPSDKTLQPKLILVRPPIDRISFVLSALRQQWQRAPILALFCGDIDRPRTDVQSELEDLDDFVCCPFKEMDLTARVHRLLHWNSGEEDRPLPRCLEKHSHLDCLIGESEPFQRVVRQIPAISRSDAMVLISGATGTGKELFARAIHYTSLRCGKPFVPVNCGALPDHLFENELFGHVKGAFTDASSAEKGLVAIAEGGTLFLDEVDTLSSAAQVKLLRLLQDREYRSLGSAQTIAADVRVIAATNTDLKRRVDEKLFRDDLYHRLHILTLNIPPLSQRTNDIPLLTRHFIRKYSKEHDPEVRLSPAAMRKLESYSWPGNVRELEGVVQRALILTSSSLIQPRDIDVPRLHYEFEPNEAMHLSEAKARTIEEFEFRYLTRALAAHGGNISRAAKAAGKERRSFQRLLRKHNIDRQPFAD